jgi:hypothetical protein
MKRKHIANKKKIDSTVIGLWVLILIMIVLTATIVFLNIRLQSDEAIKSLLMDLLNSLLSAVTVGVIATMFTQIITNNIAKIKKNNDKLKEFGVEYIGTGISTPKDTLYLFGNKLTKEYPAEIKILFISGSGFFEIFQKDLLDCLKNSNCTVKILLLSTDPSNKEYITRMEKLCPQDPTYDHQINGQAIPLLRSISERLGNNKKGQLKIRFYKDEYRYNFRIAKYCEGDDIVGKCWLNIQPFNRDAIDVSIGLNGGWNNSASSDNNIYALLDTGFDLIWDEYESTELSL